MSLKSHIVLMDKEPNNGKQNLILVSICLHSPLDYLQLCPISMTHTTQTIEASLDHTPISKVLANKAQFLFPTIEGRGALLQQTGIH